MRRNKLLLRVTAQVAILGLMVVLTACGSGETGGSVRGQLDKVKLQLGWLVNTQVAAVTVAKELGIYEKYGLDVEINPGGPNVDPIHNVVSGQMDIGMTSSAGALVLARGQGIPLKATGVLYQKHPFALFFKPESGIRSAQDMIGKTIGVQPTARWVLVAYLRHHGIDLNEVNITSVGGDLVPLASDQVDVITGWIINAGQLAAVPNAEYILTYDNGVRTYANPIFTTEKMIQERPDVLRRFMQATMEGLAYAIEHPDEAVEATLAVAPDLDGTLEAKTLEASIPLFTSPLTQEQGLGYMDVGVWQQTMDLLVATAQMPQPLEDVNSVFTNEFLGDTPKR